MILYNKAEATSFVRMAALTICSLNSGSNGNCYYIGNAHEAVLVDAGISCREVERRMSRAGLNIQKLKAIFVSHEHNDHIRGIEGLSKKYRLPVYITSNTLCNSRLRISTDVVFHFEADKPVQIGDLVVTPFTKYHDACDPHSFIISGGSVRVGVFTDIGKACTRVISRFKQCHAAFLEANYDIEMLDQGNYPYHLKRRIKGGNGHLSNEQALEIFLQHRPPYMSHLLLAHLSKNNNCPDKVYSLFSRHCGKVHVAVASRYEESAVFVITETEEKRKAPAGRMAQLVLEF